MLARVAAACSHAGRALSDVQVLPVTKNHPFEAVAFAARAGYTAVGENRVQEALEKMDAGRVACRWELIGHLQSNKAKQAAERFDRVQSVDSAKLLRKLDAAAGEAGKTLSVLLQVNAGEDPAKFGIECDQAPALFEVALALPNISVDGLMTIAPLADDQRVARRCFERLRELRDQLQTEFDSPLPELSMGMSGDLEEAVASGSTMLRIGSAFFGNR